MHALAPPQNGGCPRGLKGNPDRELVNVMPDEVNGESALRPVTAQLSDADIMQRRHDGDARWHLALELQADALRVTDPIPMFLAQLEGIPDLAQHRSPIYTILSELYSNALDYGVLRLSSMRKVDAAGFERYVTLREERLSDLGDGWVRLAVSIVRRTDGGSARIEAHDSGSGFDWQRLAAGDSDDASVKGLRLVRGLCDKLEFSERGNSVLATYSWSK
jgi:hypothetical protein